jgi:ABC-type glycerol-3-phosphate transport system substrate-binding protein
MKKTILVLIAAAILALTAACGGSSISTPTPSVQVPDGQHANVTVPTSTVASSPILHFTKGDITEDAYREKITRTIAEGGTGAADVCVAAGIANIKTITDAGRAEVVRSIGTVDYDSAARAIAIVLAACPK